MLNSRLMRPFLWAITLLSFFGCKTQQPTASYESERLHITPLSKHTYQHTSYLQTEQWGNVACNGMVVSHNGKAIIFDTPVYEEEANALIKWVENELHCKIISVVVTHFHIDCLGGLKAFHNRQIPSYANTYTIDLANEDGQILPQKGFEDQLTLRVGNQSVDVKFFGEGHTTDNVVGYFSKDKVLFGGCLIKADGSGKGNLADANVEAWSKTVQKIKNHYPKVQVVVPGHGKPGGSELLNYTIELFKEN